MRSVLVIDSFRKREIQVTNHRRGFQTQWAAQFAVASELCKRGYEVSFTMGNTAPLADLMVVSPIGRRMFLVDVEGLYRKNPWLVKAKPPNADLFYVLAFVPTDEPNQFFVITQKQVNNFIRDKLKRLGRPEDCAITGFVWKLALLHKDAWPILPE